jgi:RNA polymerase primary sigma factor
LIPDVNRAVRTSRQLFQQLGREPSAEELARRLALPVEKVRRLMAIAGLPIPVGAAAGAG